MMRGIIVYAHAKTGALKIAGQIWNAPISSKLDYLCVNKLFMGKK